MKWSAPCTSSTQWCSPHLPREAYPVLLGRLRRAAREAHPHRAARDLVGAAPYANRARRGVPTAACGACGACGHSLWCSAMLHRVLRGRRALSSSASPWLSESLPASVRSLLAPHGPALLAPRGTPNCMAPGQQVFCNREVRDRSQTRAARFLAGSTQPGAPLLPPGALRPHRGARLRL
eukprot:scaffold10280_cov64-Phaeocystis_antarctica.AAC.9